MDGRNAYEPATRWGLLVAIGAVVLVVVIGIAVLMLAGGGSGEQAESNQSASQAPAAPNPAVTPVDETVETTQTTEAAPPAEGEGSASNEDGGEQSGGSGEDTPSTGTPVSGDRESADQQQPPPEAGPGESEGPQSEGAANEPGGFDPLNKNAKPGDLTETDKGRVELAVSKFIISAYGYRGGDPTEYVRGLETNVVVPDFYDSPAGAGVTEQTQKVAEGGVESAATMERFEINKTEPELVEGTAYYEAGPVDGSQSNYRQQITLVPDGAVYKVRSASAPQEIG